MRYGPAQQHPEHWQSDLSHLGFWERFHLWCEDDAVQLQMDVWTYYGLCACVGWVQGVTFFQCFGMWPRI